MLFARPLFDKLVGLHGDKAAWKLVDANPDLVRVISFDRAFPEDINTLEDFQRIAENDERRM
jgi:CTP:molybdopterin cytidylyltransferase MocA